MNKILISLLLLVACGCSTIDRLAIKRTPVLARPATTNLVESVATNMVAVVKAETTVVSPAFTNEVGVITPAVVTVAYSTNYQPILSTQLVQVVKPEVWSTNMALSPTVANGVQTGLNLTGVPWAGTAAQIALGLSTLVFGFLNKRNAAKAVAAADGQAEALGKLETATLVGKTLVENVETIRGMVRSVPGGEAVDDKAMAFIKNAQALAGVKSEIHDLVEEHTDPTK